MSRRSPHPTGSPAEYPARPAWQTHQRRRSFKNNEAFSFFRNEAPTMAVYFLSLWVFGLIMIAFQAVVIGVVVMMALRALHHTWHQVPAWGYGTSVVVVFAFVLLANGAFGSAPSITTSSKN